jgi:hypothetical protein
MSGIEFDCIRPVKIVRSRLPKFPRAGLTAGRQNVGHNQRDEFQGANLNSPEAGGE